MEGRTARLKRKPRPPRGAGRPQRERSAKMEMLIYEILATADRAVDERWHEVGEVTDATMAKLRKLMERYHKVAEGGVK